MVVVVSVGLAVVVSLAAAVGSVEVSAAAVVVVSPPPLTRLNSEPNPLHPLQEHPVMASTKIRAVTAINILIRRDFFPDILTPPLMRVIKLQSNYNIPVCV